MRYFSKASSNGKFEVFNRKTFYGNQPNPKKMLEKNNKSRKLKIVQIFARSH